MPFENLYSDDMDLEIRFRENDLNQDVYHHQIMESCRFLDEMIFLESGEDSGASEEKSDGVISRIVQQIKEYIEKAIDFIKGIFRSINVSVGEQLSPEDYMASDTISADLYNQAQSIQKQLEEEIFKGRKIVSKISNFTGIDPSIIADYVDSAKKFVIEKGPTVTTTAATVLIANKLSKTIVNGKGMMEENKKMADEIERKAEIQYKQKVAKQKKDGHKYLAYLSQVSHVISKRMNQATSIYMKTLNEINRFKKIKGKKEKRKDKIKKHK